MDLHEQLRGLVDRMGPGVLDDAEGLRGALDDYLDEGAASTGDLNLLVDAVRLGAYRSFTEMLGSGASAGMALDEVGARLARDRGVADVAGSSWALAVLGFANGQVGDADVRRYRSMHAMPGQTPSTTPPPSSPPAAPPPAAPTMPPPAPGSWDAPPAAAAPTMFPGSGSVPTPPPTPHQPTPVQAPGYAPGQAPAASSWGSAPAPGAPGAPMGPGSWGPPTPTPGGGGGGGGRKTGLIVAAAVLVLLIIGGGVAAALTLGGDDDTSARDDESSQSDSPTDTPTDTPTDSPTDTPTDTPTETTPVSAGVCQTDALGYADALTRFTPKYTAASDRLLNGVNNKIFTETLGGAYDMRATIYDFDADVRALDLSAIQLTVNELLVVNGDMIDRLDQIQNTGTSRSAIRKVNELPTDKFIEAFSKVADEIDANTDTSC